MLQLSWYNLHCDILAPPATNVPLTIIEGESYWFQLFLLWSYVVHWWQVALPMSQLNIIKYTQNGSCTSGIYTFWKCHFLIPKYKGIKGQLSQIAASISFWYSSTNRVKKQARGEGPTGSPVLDCDKVKAYISIKYWLEMSTQGIWCFRGKYLAIALFLP